MRKRLISVLVFACTAALFVPATASAQQTLNFSLGVFTPRGEDARTDGDVLNANRTFLFFDIKAPLWVILAIVAILAALLDGVVARAYRKMRGKEPKQRS